MGNNIGSRPYIAQGALLAELRRQSGRSLRVCAKILGVSPLEFGAWIRGTERIPEAMLPKVVGLLTETDGSDQ